MKIETAEQFNKRLTRDFCKSINNDANLQRAMLNVLQNGATIENVTLLTRTAYDVGMEMGANELKKILKGELKLVEN